MFSKELKYIALIPALLLAYDFLPLWYIYLNIGFIFYLSFFKTHKFISYINFIVPFMIFNEVGKKIIPETMVPILCSFIIAQLIYNKAISKKENYLLFLWIGALSLFSSGFYYLIYAVICFLLLITLENQDQGIDLKRVFKGIKDNYKQLTITFVLTTFLFIFFPRFQNFLPSANSQLQGQIGYSKEVNNSTTANLQTSSKIAFFAELSTKLSPSLLYWRGRTLSYTDGYNWRYQELFPQRIKRHRSNKAIKQQLKYEQDFNKDLILLNHPQNLLETNLRTYHLPLDNQYRSYRKMKKAYVEGLSNLNEFPEVILSEKNITRLLQLPKFTPNEMKNLLAEISGQKPDEIISSFKRIMLKDQYSYSLSPGFMPTITDFIRNKKGFCTHFASLLGLVFRHKGIPARLINGFQGGTYNETGNFYEVKSNDAHTWVEYYHNKKWNMIDPTNFIAPDRINLGGEGFLNPTIIPGKSENDFIVFKLFYQTKQYLDIINYRVSLFLDNYNKDKQIDFSKSLKIDFKSFFIAGIILGILLLWLYYFILTKPKKKHIHPADKILFQVAKALKINLEHTTTISSIKESFSSIQSENTNTFLTLYQEARYGNKNHYQELKKIAKLIKNKE